MRKTSSIKEKNEQCNLVDISNMQGDAGRRQLQKNLYLCQHKENTASMK